MGASLQEQALVKLSNGPQVPPVLTSAPDTNDNAVAFDKARAGSSAFKAAAARALQLEIAQAIGKCAAALLWDVHKYFDSVNIAELSSRAQEARYPVLDLAMGLQMHIAPRVLQHQKNCSQATQVTQSILAGCSQAVPFTKAYLNAELCKLQEPGIQLGVYIDDVGMSTTGTTFAVVQLLADAGAKFVRCMQAAKLKVAAKSVLMASSAGGSAASLQLRASTWTQRRSPETWGSR